MTDEISPEPGTSLTVHSGFSGELVGERLCHDIMVDKRFTRGI